MTEKTNVWAIITDKLVVEKTKKTMQEWFALLDKMGAKKMKHAGIFELVSKTNGLKPLGTWNQNLLATSYEWDRKLKERGQKEKDFEVSVSKTIDVPITTLYQSWTDESIRKKWLNEKIIIRKCTPDKSARITWSDQKTSLSVDFYLKSKDKSQVVVQHLKIPDAKNAGELKQYWAKKLATLKSFLEK